MEEGRRRSAAEPELELVDSGAFADNRYFDVFTEYAKADTDDILIRITRHNRGPDAAPLHVLPTLWQRNTWDWGRTCEGYWPKGRMARQGPGRVSIEHPSLGLYQLDYEPRGGPPRLLFTENETNARRLFAAPNASAYVKDAFHRSVVEGEEGAVNPEHWGSKVCGWYTLSVPAGGMLPSGQLPAYELALGDVNPPVHAWAVWRVYQLDAHRGAGKDRVFLEGAFQKCLINFTWWVNREDVDGDNLFSGGFLGLDNVGVFDRCKPLPGGARLQQADATARMAFYCTTMLAMALELAETRPAYADIASKFFEHFVGIAQAMNQLGGAGLWNEEDGFYYDQMLVGGRATALRVRSMVGLIPLFAVQSLESAQLERLPLFKGRLEWFLLNRPDLTRSIACMRPHASHAQRLLAIPTRERLTRVLARVLDEQEFLSPYGVRSLSRVHLKEPFALELEGERHEVRYAPADSATKTFGGNSNWRGPVWFPLNYLLIEALER